MVANGKDDSPLKDAVITIDGSNSKTTDENGNHVEKHCAALKDKKFPIKKDDFCSAEVEVKELEGDKAYRWAFLHPKSSKI